MNSKAIRNKTYHLWGDSIGQGVIFNEDRKRYCLAPKRCARILQEEGHLNCTAYWQKKGVNRGGKKTQPNPYKWKNATIQKILTR